MAEHGSNRREILDLPPLRGGRRGKNSPTPFAHLLRYHMERAGMSTRDMAEMLGISASGVGHLLTGFVRPPIGDQLYKIIQILHLSQEESEKLDFEALMGNSPDRMREYVEELQKRAKGK